MTHAHTTGSSALLNHIPSSGKNAVGQSVLNVMGTSANGSFHCGTGRATDPINSKDLNTLSMNIGRQMSHSSDTSALYHGGIPDEMVVSNLVHANHIFAMADEMDPEMRMCPKALILVCGWPRNLLQFLKTLMDFSEGVSVHVVVLAPEIPYYDSLDTFLHEEIYPRAVFIKGSALNRSDLMRAGVLEALSVVVFAAPHAPEGILQDSQVSAMKCTGYEVDIESVLSVQKIRSMRASVSEQQEEKPPELKYTNGLNLQRGILICELKDMTAHLSDLDNSIWMMDPTSDKPTQYLDSMEYAAGGVWMDEIMYSVASMAIAPQLMNHSIVPAVELMELLLDGGVENATRFGKQPCLSLLVIPECWVRETYHHLWLTLLEQGLLAIGLYRELLDSTNVGNPGRYVVTSPEKTWNLRRGDSVYVIGTSKAAASELQRPSSTESHAEPVPVPTVQYTGVNTRNVEQKRTLQFEDELETMKKTTSSIKVSTKDGNERQPSKDKEAHPPAFERGEKPSTSTLSNNSRAEKIVMSAKSVTFTRD
eukprot:gnl/MRDRNA2_/MRDRNA2_65951_c0_seq1.p1 gnl/MRDRNA2_/MRDRNA2_65951_c0~~gnl/MRDRNA2_/MRDRNA2_65951_c0_seq1.p1  ORF type:complete len:549 (+),score=81.43 gnl/MRDRNA2_/MRDRNA2_65951_c0_seq1:42-1649(+)